MNRILPTVICASLLFAFGCSKDRRAATDETGRTPTTSDEKAYVRVVNAMSTAEAVDVSAGDKATFSGVSPKMVTPYRELPDERLTFRVMPAGRNTGEPLAEDSTGLGEGKYYTAVVLADKNNKTHIKMIEDTTGVPDAGKAKIRVVHAAADVGDLDVYTTGKSDALLDGIDAKDETRYVQIDPVLGDLEIRRDDNNKVIGRVSGAKIEAGKAYTVIVTGHEPALSAVLLEDKIKDRNLTPSPVPTAGNRRG